MGGALGGCICCFSSSSARSLSCFLFFLFLLGVSAFCCACMLRMEPERHVGIHHTQRNFSPPKQQAKAKQQEQQNKQGELTTKPNKPLTPLACLSLSFLLFLLGCLWPCFHSQTHKQKHKHKRTKACGEQQPCKLGGLCGGFFEHHHHPFSFILPLPLLFFFFVSSSLFLLLLCFCFFPCVCFVLGCTVRCHGFVWSHGQAKAGL